MLGKQPHPSARALLGGRWAVSLRGGLIFSALLLIGGSVGALSQLEMPPRAVVTLALISWLVISVLYLAADLTVFRQRRTRPVPVAWLIALGASAGLARGAIALALPESRAVLGDGWSGVATAAAYFVPPTVLMTVLITYLIAITDWYATERARLLLFEIDAEAARLRAVGALNAARAVITTRIQNSLEEQLSARERAAKGANPAARLSDILLDAAAGYVRPESHRLWQERDGMPRRSSLGDLERASLAAPLPIVLPYVMWATVVVPAAAVHLGGATRLAGALAVLAAMAVLYPLGSAAIRRYAPAPHYLRARLLSLVVMIPAALIGPIVAAALGLDATSTLERVVPVAVIVALTIAVSWAQAALRLADTRLHTLRNHAEEAEFERLALEAATEQMQRDLALYLHGTVQAGLVASAYAIQDAAARGDKIALEQAIDGARAAAARADEHTPAVTRDLAAVRAAIDETWGGVLAVRWILPDSELSATVVDRLGKVARECLANASIHGAASEVTVRIVVDVEQVIVEITDNGRGLGDGSPGLGSAVLNEATGGQWTIASVPTGGAQVRAVVPV
jgi:two-component system sensor histidine kinase DesK